MIHFNVVILKISCHNNKNKAHWFCQTLGLVLRLRVDFVLPLSQQQQQQEEEEEEEPLTKLYQKGVC